MLDACGAGGAYTKVVIMSRRAVVLLITILLAAPLGPLAAQYDSNDDGYPRRLPDAEYTVGVRVWLDGPDLYRRGTGARVSFRAEEDAFVVIARVDADGEVHVLYPSGIHDDGFVRGGRTYDVPGYGYYTFRVHEYTGLGYVFALASREPFALDRIRTHGFWSYHPAGGRVHGDPYEAMRDFADYLLDDSRAPYALHYTTYYIDRRVDYPRFLCYNCHSYRPYHRWDPYAHHCSRFRIVIFANPIFYPYRYRHGSRVVYVIRPPDRFRHFEFKSVGDHDRVTRENFIERRRRTDVGDGRSTRVIDDRVVDRRDRSGDPGATRPGDPVDVDNRGVRRRERDGWDGGRRDVSRSTSVPDAPRRELPRTEPSRSEPRRGEPRVLEGRPVEPRRAEPRRSPSPRVESSRSSPSARAPSRSPASSSRGAGPSSSRPSNVGARRRAP
jgi:hypothetical protein